MDHSRRLGHGISIQIPADESAFTGRECPQPDCVGYMRACPPWLRIWRGESESNILSALRETFLQ